MADHNEVLDKVQAVLDQGEAEGLILSQIKGRIERLRGELDAEVDAGFEVVEEDAEVVEQTLEEKIAAAGTHAKLHTLAGDLGVEVPADASEPWTFGEGETATVAKTVAEKQAALGEATAPADEPEPEPTAET